MKRPNAGLWLLLTAAVSVQAEARLEHRVWLMDPSLTAEEVSQLRGAGIDGAVVPVGSAEIAQGAARLTLDPLPDPRGLDGWGVVPLVWVRGDGDAAGDAEAFLSQFGVVAKVFRQRAGVVLAAREYWPGLPRFAGAVAKRLGASVEVAMPAVALAQQLTPGGWPGVLANAVAFGNPTALGFSASTLHDDLHALDSLDDLGVTYRVSLVVLPTVKPPASGGGESLAELARSTVADYQPSQRGDAFILRSSLAWGGALLSRGTTVEIDFVDTARYDRDLGMLMRPVRNGLTGWDTAGLPPSGTAIGMNREALLDYMTGNPPRPVPEIVVEWTGATRMRVAVGNASPHGSAAATTGNWIEIAFPGGIIGDLDLGDFRGVEYGVLNGSRFRKAGSGEASALRLYVTLLPPGSQIGAAEVRFVQRPRELTGRWGLRLSDGRDVTGTPQPLPLGGR